MKTSATLLALVATTTLLAACGGSSSGGDSATPKATLTAAPASIELFAGTDAPVTLTITNTSSSATATAVGATLPGSWSDVTQDVGGCATLPPQSQCTLSFTPGNTSHAATEITIGGQNAEPTSATITVSPFNGANIVALSATTLTLSTGMSATISLQNTSSQVTATHITADLHGTPLLNALTQDASDCINVLPGASCQLHLTAGNTTVTSTNFPIHGDNTSSIGGAIEIAIPTSATITIAGSPLILPGTNGTPTAGTLTITNTSTTLTATNISADIASTALAGNVAQDASACATLPPLASCNLLFTPGAAAVATTPITIQGDNTSQVGASIAVNASVATLTIAGSPLVLHPNGASGNLTVTNTSATETALNITSNFTATSLAGNVTETGNTCASVAPASTCTLTFTPGANSVAQTPFSIAGTNTSTTAANITIRGLMIGDAFAGGIVFELPAGGNPGKIVSTVETNLPWDSLAGTVGPTAQSNSDGAANTIAIVASLTAGTTYAAGYCDAYSTIDASVTYSDWYLPAANELDALLQQTTLNGGPISGFGTSYYWTSTEWDAANWEAGVQAYNTSAGGFHPKYDNDTVRCIRAFTN